MTTPTIPSGIIPLIDGNVYDGGLGADVSPIAGGTGVKAEEFNSGMIQFTVVMNLTPLKFFVWMCFFHHIIKKGVIGFLMPLNSGLGTTDHLCNIVPETHSAQRIEYSQWQVSFTAEAEASIYA